MTTINNSELIEKVGGIEKARRIVDSAPKYAQRYFLGKYLKQGEWTWWWSSYVSKWLQFEKHIYGNSKFEIATDLNDLRTAIAEYSTDSPDSYGWVGVHYKLGDHIVYKKPWVGHNLVLKIGGDGNQSMSLASASLSQNYIRHATPEEIKAGHRIDDTTDHVTGIRNHVSLSTVVTDLNVNETDKLNRLG